MGYRENCGILGTPLHFGVAHEFKLSAQNKIAPTSAAYAKLKQKEIANEERTLLEKTSILATNGNNLYAKDGGCNDPGELMDKEDRTHLRVRGSIKRNRLQAESLGQEGTSSFWAKSAEIPEIVPKQARTIHGYGVLQRTYSLRRVEVSTFQPKAGPSALYHAPFYSSMELQRESGTGLGYRDDEEPIRKSDISLENRTFFGLREEKYMKGFRAVTRSDNGNGEDDMNELANSGYRDLDLTAKLLSQRLQESRANSAGKTSTKKRTAGNVDDTLEERVRFSQYSQSQLVDVVLWEWTEYEIPTSFAADPTHKFKTDSMKTIMTDLSEQIRQEYAASLKLYTENRRKETEASRISFAKAKEEHDARSRRIRDLIVKDMGSRFIEPNELQTQENAPRNPECEKLGVSCKTSTTESPKRGKANRTSQLWKPKNLLCRRLGIETGTAMRKLNIPKTRAPGSGKLLSSHGDDDEFLLHSVAPVSAGVFEFSDENILTSDELAGLHGYEDFRNMDFNINNYIVNMSSNQRLAQAIFTNAKIEDGTAKQPDCNLSREANDRGNSRSNDDHNRRVHRIRAVDFF